MLHGYQLGRVGVGAGAMVSIGRDAADPLHGQGEFRQSVECPQVVRGEDHVVLEEVGHRRPEQSQQDRFGAPHISGDAEVRRRDALGRPENTPKQVDTGLDLGGIGHSPVGVPAEMAVLEEMNTLASHAAILRSEAGERFGKEFRAVEGQDRDRSVSWKSARQVPAEKP